MPRLQWKRSQGIYQPAEGGQIRESHSRHVSSCPGWFPGRLWLIFQWLESQIHGPQQWIMRLPLPPPSDDVIKGSENIGCVSIYNVVLAKAGSGKENNMCVSIQLHIITAIDECNVQEALLLINNVQFSMYIFDSGLRIMLWNQSSNHMVRQCRVSGYTGTRIPDRNCHYPVPFFRSNYL